MNKIILSTFVISGFFAQTALAQDPIYFTTLEQAQKYCPPLTAKNYDLIFKPSSSAPNSAGIIYGTSQNNVRFSSGSTIQPLNWDSLGSGLIYDAKFRTVDGNYGYISGNQITCYYSYQGFTGVIVNVNLKA